jgi:L-fucose isomerase-like protein
MAKRKMKNNEKTVYLISNGDFRDSAGEICWPKQKETLDAVKVAFTKLGYTAEVLPKHDASRKHGFLTKQCAGAEVFSMVDPTAPVVIVLSCWAYSHHVAGSLQTHKGPILLVANFDGTWPGLVALLNHAATLERLCVKHSRLWSETFADDPHFMKRLENWRKTGEINYDMSHLVDAEGLKLSAKANRFGEDLAHDIIRKKRIMGQLDPGCMGMLNAVISPAKLGAIGMPVELLNQSDLVAEMALVDNQEAQNHVNWLVKKGAWFDWGTDQYEDLVHGQVLMQMKMYSAAARIYQRYGLSAIGIPYQVGLVRSVPASDLAEGMLNNSDRPDVIDLDTGKVIKKGKPIVHFNEGDIGSGIPQVLMHDIYERKGMPPETTLHDIRWGRDYEGRFIWVFEISGGAPPAHFGGWKNAKIYRQPKMYFPLGGGTCSGVSKPGVITWARFYERFGEIGMDCGTGEVTELPEQEIGDRLGRTTAEWPIANVYIPGYDRDQVMASHMSNHITIGYGDILQELVATCLHLGIPTRVAGDIKDALR